MQTLTQLIYSNNNGMGNKDIEGYQVADCGHRFLHGNMADRLRNANCLVKMPLLIMKIKDVLNKALSNLFSRALAVPAKDR